MVTGVTIVYGVSLSKVRRMRAHDAQGRSVHSSPMLLPGANGEVIGVQ